MPTIAIWLPDAEDKKIRAIAARENRSDSNTIATLIKGVHVVDAGVIPAPADADPEVRGVPFISVSQGA